MKGISLGCMLCLLQLVNAVCECGVGKLSCTYCYLGCYAMIARPVVEIIVPNHNLSFIAGQQSFIPSLVNIDPPSPFNGTDGSPSSFDTCVLHFSSGVYICTNNIDNPLFDCSASGNNSYYGWDHSQSQDPIALFANFSNHFQSLNILMIFLISISSNVSAPSLIQYRPFQTVDEYTARFVAPTSEDSPPTNLQEGPYQHNFTLSPDVMFNGGVITIIPSNTSQWVAINRIIFCAAATEGL